jgi:hypothetical protein
MSMKEMKNGTKQIFELSCGSLSTYPDSGKRTVGLGVYDR